MGLDSRAGLGQSTQLLATQQQLCGTSCCVSSQKTAAVSPLRKYTTSSQKKYYTVLCTSS